MLNRLKRLFLTRSAYKFFLREIENGLGVAEAQGILETLRLNRRLATVQMVRPRGKRILVISPHPDDEVIGPGGTLIQAQNSGATISILYLTGHPESQRGKEAQNVAGVMKWDASFLNFPEGNIPMAREAAQQFANAFNAVRPDTVYVPFLLDDHPDHRDASHMLATAVEQRLIDANFEVWAFQVYTMIPANVVVDISDAAEEKARLIRLYRSVMEVRDWAHWSLSMNAVLSRFLPRSPNRRYAEMFFVLPGREYADLCRGRLGHQSERGGS